MVGGIGVRDGLAKADLDLKVLSGLDALGQIDDWGVLFGLPVRALDNLADCCLV